MNCFLTRPLWVGRWLPLTESFRGVIIFFPIYTSYESSFENGLRVFIITFEISLHAHLRNVLKYDYLIMKTKEAISLMTLKTIISFEFSSQRRNLFYIGFSKPWLSLRMHRCDSCPQHEPWQFARTSEFTALRTFNQGLPTKQRAERAWKLLPSVCVSPSQNDGLRTRSHGVSRKLRLRSQNSDPPGVSKTQTLLRYLILAISLMARFWGNAFVREMEWNRYEILQPSSQGFFHKKMGGREKARQRPGKGPASTSHMTQKTPRNCGCNKCYVINSSVHILQ